jgi:hypothetical protein
MNPKVAVIANDQQDSIGMISAGLIVNVALALR